MIMIVIGETVWWLCAASLYGGQFGSTTALLWFGAEIAIAGN